MYNFIPFLKKFQDILKFLEKIFVKLRTTEDKQPKYRSRQAFLKKMPIRAEIRVRANYCEVIATWYLFWSPQK